MYTSTKILKPSESPKSSTSISVAPTFLSDLAPTAENTYRSLGKISSWKYSWEKNLW